ncbi:MAG: hypothetical protein KAU31_05105, partial [Spirochaetaceae bacterium]|nr:hypothetical protein [Spirochaetaceae bacterium]
PEPEPEQEVQTEETAPEAQREVVTDVARESWEKTFTGNIGVKTDVLEYAFSGRKNHLLSLDLTNAPAISSDVDYFVSLANPAGDVIARLEEWDGSDGTTVLRTIAYLPEAGDYLVSVWDNQRDDADPDHPFTLTIAQRPEPDGNEPNNGPNFDSDKLLATALESGQRMTGMIEYRGDMDWYHFSTQGNEIVRIALDNAPEISSDVDYFVDLYSAREEWLTRLEEWNGDDGTTVLESVAYLPRRGDYYLAVWDNQDDDYEETGEYHLTATVMAEPDINEPNNGPNFDSNKLLATPIEIGATTEGMIASRGDVDWYRLSAQKGQTVHVTLDNAPESACDVDYFVAIYTSREEELMRLEEWNGADGTTRLAGSVTFDAGGDYYLAVWDNQDDEYEETSGYSLTTAIETN